MVERLHNHTNMFGIIVGKKKQKKSPFDNLLRFQLFVCIFKAIFNFHHVKLKKYYCINLKSYGTPFAFYKFD